MHTNNKKFLDRIVAEYPEFTGRCKILELGSGSVSFAGTIRPWFKDCQAYVGVDIEAGECVDFVCEAKDFKWDGELFDTIVSFSMLEHDLEWRESLENCLKYLKPGGMIFMCWGAEGNLPHMEVFALVPHQEVLDFFKEHGVKVLDSFFEEDRYGKDCAGAFDLIAIKNE